MHRVFDKGYRLGSQPDPWLHRPSSSDGKCWIWDVVGTGHIFHPGKHSVEFDFTYEGLGAGTLAYNSMSGLARPGTGTLKVDGKVVDTKEMEKTLPMILQWDESFDIGSDTLTGVNDADYKPPFTLTAKLDKLTIKVDRPKLSPEDIRTFEEEMKKVAAGRE